MKSDDWDKKERDLDKHEHSTNNSLSNLLAEINKCRRNFKLLEIKYDELDKDLQFMAKKMIKILKILKAHNIKV